MSEKNEYLLDLRKSGKGCTETPMIRLSNTLSRLGEGDRLRILALKSLLPYKVVELLAKKKGLTIEFVEHKDDEYIVMVRK
jgi:TusA-related sulfurtransferase